jgi:hypothetical protein
MNQRQPKRGGRSRAATADLRGAASFDSSPLNIQPWLESEGLRIAGLPDVDPRPYIAGETRKFTIMVENLENRERSGALVLYFQYGTDRFPSVDRFKLRPRRSEVIVIRGFSPAAEGNYQLRLATGAYPLDLKEPWFEFFGRQEDSWLFERFRSWSTYTICSFKAFDATTYTEMTQRDASERRNRLALWVAVVTAVVGVASLIVGLAALGWLK